MMSFYINIVFRMTGILLCLAAPAFAYIGPGAGFAMISSFFVLFFSVIVAFATVISWPVRALVIHLKRGKIKAKSKVRRMIILGFDGLDPDLCIKYMDEGKLPHLSKLRNSGYFRSLETTTPALSPVAWSSFATGVNPGKHNIFDFFTRDVADYLPVLSSSKISHSRKTFSIRPFQLPGLKTTIKLLRKSIPFWIILGKMKVFGTILRVPVTFPPEKFYGACLSAMCTPDLRGTQGSFTLYSTQLRQDDNEPMEGAIVPIHIENTEFETDIKGPAVPARSGERHLTLPLKGLIDRKHNQVKININGKALLLTPGEYSPWVPLVFKVNFRKTIKGLARFLVTEMEPDFKLYMTPINIDPEHPALPVSHPFYYAICLSKIYGPFSTLGLAEDTWALNEGAINEAQFLTQSYDIYEARKKIFLDHLEKCREGLLVNVFDTTDRIQHMFFRYLHPDHPANEGRPNRQHQDVIEKLYRKADHLVGEVSARIDDRDLLFILSDHGFKSFEWGVNLNTWLHKEGYLVLKSGTRQARKWFADVDWTRSTAYAFGLAGIFINTIGREKSGIVTPGDEKNKLIREIKEKLETLHHAGRGIKPIRNLYLSQQLLNGPYKDEAPDIFVGYEAGYRVSWNCAIGLITDEVLEVNRKQWSGDHCLDPAIVPGVLFSNWQSNVESPSICDIAPTVLNMFGVEKPEYQDGSVLHFYR